MLHGIRDFLKVLKKRERAKTATPKVKESETKTRKPAHTKRPKILAQTKKPKGKGKAAKVEATHEKVEATPTKRASTLSELKENWKGEDWKDGWGRDGEWSSPEEVFFQ